MPEHKKMVGGIHMSAVENITQLREKVRGFEMKEVELKTKLEAAQERLESANAQCQAQGIEPDQLDKTIQNLEKRMETLAKNIEELLPDGDNGERQQPF